MMKKTNVIEAVLFSGLVSSSSGVVISWTVTDLIAGGNNANFISTNGESVIALNGTNTTAGTVTANGVEFDNIGLSEATMGITNNGVTFTSAGAVGENSSAFRSVGFSDASVSALIQSAIFNVPDFTFSGLTLGQEYEIQFLINDSRTNGGRGPNWVVGVNDGEGDTVAALGQLRNTVPSGDGDTGDFFLGTFIADETTQTVTLTGTRVGNISIGDDISVVPNGGQRQFQAIQLRAIPEPSTALLLGLAGSFTLLRRRK